MTHANFTGVKSIKHVIPALILWPRSAAWKHFIPDLTGTSAASYMLHLSPKDKHIELIDGSDFDNCASAAQHRWL